MVALVGDAEVSESEGELDAPEQPGRERLGKGSMMLGDEIQVGRSPGGIEGLTGEIRLNYKCSVCLELAGGTRQGRKEHSSNPSNRTPIALCNPR